jgi:hypothetical protein
MNADNSVVRAAIEWRAERDAAERQQGKPSLQ